MRRLRRRMPRASADTGERLEARRRARGGAATEALGALGAIARHERHQHAEEGQPKGAGRSEPATPSPMGRSRGDHPCDGLCPSPAETTRLEEMTMSDRAWRRRGERGARGGWSSGRIAAPGSRRCERRDRGGWRSRRCGGRGGGARGRPAPAAVSGDDVARDGSGGPPRRSSSVVEVAPIFAAARSRGATGTAEAERPTSIAIPCPSRRAAREDPHARPR